MLDDFDSHVSRIYQRRLFRSLLFSRDTAVVLFVVALVFLGLTS